MRYSGMFQEAEAEQEVGTQYRNRRWMRRRHLWGSWQLWGSRQLIKFCLCQLVYAAKARAVLGGMWRIPTVKATVGVLAAKLGRVHQLRIMDETEGTNCLPDILLSFGEGCCRHHELGLSR
eukprot:785064-Ditylum_brightwellii.AAC.2